MGCVSQYQIERHHHGDNAEDGRENETDMVESQVIPIPERYFADYVYCSAWK